MARLPSLRFEVHHGLSWVRSPAGFEWLRARACGVIPRSTLTDRKTAGRSCGRQRRPARYAPVGRGVPRMMARKRWRNFSLRLPDLVCQCMTLPMDRAASRSIKHRTVLKNCAGAARADAAKLTKTTFSDTAGRAGTTGSRRAARSQ